MGPPGLALLLLAQRLNVSLSLLDVCSLANNLDARLAAALSGNINRDLELRLEPSLDITTAADQGPVLLLRNIKHLSNLVLAFRDNSLNLGNNLVNDIGAPFDLDCVPIRILLGELDGASKVASIIRPTGFDDNVTKVGT